MQGEVGEWAIRLLTGQQRMPLSDKALRSGIGRTMLQASVGVSQALLTMPIDGLQFWADDSFSDAAPVTCLK